jgi:hypothetical protein
MLLCWLNIFICSSSYYYCRSVYFLIVIGIFIFFWFLSVLLSFIIAVVQWKPLHVITDNVIIWLMWSIWLRLTQSQVTVYWVLCFSVRLLIVIIRLMLSILVCPKVIRLSNLHCFSKKFLIVIIRLMLSPFVCPNVITLSSLHCITNLLIVFWASLFTLTENNQCYHCNWFNKILK